MEILIAVLVCIAFAGLMEFRDWRHSVREKKWRLKIEAMKRTTDRELKTVTELLAAVATTHERVELLAKQVQETSEAQKSALEMIHALKGSIDGMVKEYEVRIRSHGAEADYIEGI